MPVIHHQPALPEEAEWVLPCVAWFWAAQVSSLNSEHAHVCGCTVRVVAVSGYVQVLHGDVQACSNSLDAPMFWTCLESSRDKAQVACIEALNNVEAQGCRFRVAWSFTQRRTFALACALLMSDATADPLRKRQVMSKIRSCDPL